MLACRSSGRGDACRGGAVGDRPRCNCRHSTADEDQDSRLPGRIEDGHSALVGEPWPDAIRGPWGVVPYGSTGRAFARNSGTDRPVRKRRRRHDRVTQTSRCASSATRCSSVDSPTSLLTTSLVHNGHHMTSPTPGGCSTREARRRPAMRCSRAREYLPMSGFQAADGATHRAPLTIRVAAMRLRGIDEIQ